MNPSSGYQSYKQNTVLTASPEQLVVMLYDGALKFLARTALAMRGDQPSQAGMPMRRAQAIIDELLATLDMEAGEVAERLQSIYVFCTRLLTEAQLEKSPEKVEQVAKLLKELRDAWAQVSANGTPAPASATA